MIRLVCVAAVVTGLSGIATAFPHAQSARAKTQWDAVYTDAQADRGAAIYRAQCVSCHLLDASAPRRDWQSVLVFGGDFEAAWGGETFDRFVTRILITMPPQPLVKPQDRKQLLSREDATDVFAYLLRLNGAPAGENELQPSRESLRAFAFARPAQ